MLEDSPIVRIAARGDGVTEDGRHSPQAAPGDLLRIDGSIIPGPHHATPPCRHFPRCGGCQLQHIDDVAYADYLNQRVISALHAQKIDAPELRAPYISPPNTRRRASLRAERMGKKIVIGFNAAASHNIVDMRQCEIVVPEIFALIEPLRRLLQPLLRDRRAAGVQMTLTDQGIDLLIEKVEIEGLAATESLIDFAQGHRLARLSIDEGYGAEARWEPDPVTVTIGGVTVSFPAGGFLQATADGEAALVRAVQEAAGQAQRGIDLFAGLGTFTNAVSSVDRAVEGHRLAALALQQSAGRAQRPLAVEHRDLFRRPLSLAELNVHDLVILDPPRSGAREQMPDLAKSEVAHIAYVSCNPATLARDIRTLIEGGYKLDWIQAVGQFRWSTHVELVAALTR